MCYNQRKGREKHVLRCVVDVIQRLKILIAAITKKKEHAV